MKYILVLPKITSRPSFEGDFKKRARPPSFAQSLPHRPNGERRTATKPFIRPVNSPCQDSEHKFGRRIVARARVRSVAAFREQLRFRYPIALRISNSSFSRVGITLSDRWLLFRDGPSHPMERIEVLTVKAPFHSGKGRI